MTQGRPVAEKLSECADRGQRDVDDRDVEDDHELGETDGQQQEVLAPGAREMAYGIHRSSFRVIKTTKPAGRFGRQPVHRCFVFVALPNGPAAGIRAERGRLYP